MPFSHHSHSGQFCGHGENLLEDIVKVAIKKSMELYILTEHMPREEEDLYPEEVMLHTSCIAVSLLTLPQKESSPSLFKLFNDYYQEARRLQTIYASAIKLAIGMEVDWIRPSSKEFIEALLSKYQIEVFIGSVHHVHTIPIDFSSDMYAEARQKSGGTEEELFEDYFDAQLEMLRALRPPIVGHFDLIRLLSSDPNQSFLLYQTVWQKILRNLVYIQQYGGVLELNSAALRKGMAEPYPKGEICKVRFHWEELYLETTLTLSF